MIHTRKVKEIPCRHCNKTSNNKQEEQPFCLWTRTTSSKGLHLSSSTSAYSLSVERKGGGFGSWRCPLKSAILLPAASVEEAATPMANMSETRKEGEATSSSGRPKPQYNYFYGSTADANDALTIATNDTGSLIGEALVGTDNEEETIPLKNENGMATNGKAGKSWFGAKTKPAQSVCRVSLILMVALSGMMFLMFMIPHSSHPIPEAQKVYVPFEKVSRVEYGDPVDGFLNMELFHPALLSNDDEHIFNAPFPTGAWWTNLVVQSDEEKYSYPIVAYPYAYKWSKTSLQLAYPAAHRLEDKNHKWMIDTFAPELTISTVEVPRSRFVTKYDPLSVTMRFVSATDSKWETMLVQGSPYTTIRYLKATPTIQTLSTFKSVLCPGDAAEDFHDFEDMNHDDDGVGFGNAQDDDDSTRRQLFGVCSIEDNGDKSILRGVQFMLTSKEGAYWILFSSEPIVLEYDNLRKTTITATSPFTGVIRIARVPAEVPSDISAFSSTGLRRLIYHAGVYPTDAVISWDFHPQTATQSKVSSSSTGAKTSRHASLKFSFKTLTFSDDTEQPASNTIPLLMLSLPHHVHNLPKSVQLSSKRFDLNYTCIKGPMTPIVGSDWTFDEPLMDLNFEATPSKLNVDPGVKQIILDQVKQDMTRVLPETGENIYGYGKQVARLAQMVHIVYMLCGDKESDESTSSLLEDGKKLLLFYLESFLSCEVADHLVFDIDIGGLVSTDGLSDKTSDFGNGRYNDHHFHYGYLLYACAIMARLDSSFVERFGNHVDAIFHDIAHSSNGDSKPIVPGSAFFPLSRHKSWFDGHSFATGLFPFGDGKSQESSSEAVNCYYGAYLWSYVRHGNGSVQSDLTDFARLLFAMEVRATQYYWHMLPKHGNHTNTLGIYSPTFQQNYMVGNVGMLDVAANTWFGNDALYVHMINAIPITSATAILFNPNYVKHEYKYLMGTRDEVEMAWRGYTTAIHSIIDPNQAWVDAQSLVSYELDAAISKSQVLYFIITRPGFKVTVETTHSGGRDSSELSSCSAHPQCHALGMTGECCPTSEGSYLGCCDSSFSNSSPETGAPTNVSNPDVDDDSSCDAHSECQALGITGKCCPTKDRSYLGCCDDSSKPLTLGSENETAPSHQDPNSRL